MTTQITKNLLRRTAAAFAAVACFVFAGDAAAQSVTLSGATGNTCTYSSMSVLPNGSVSVSCIGTDPGNPGTFNLSVNSAAVVGNQLTATISRGGGTAGAVSVNWGVTGVGCTNASGSATFGAGDASGKTFQVTALAPGVCVVSISNPSSGTLGVGQVNITVTAAGGGQPIDGCPAIPTDLVEATLIQGGKLFLGLASGQVGSLALPPTNPGHNSGAVKLGETTNSPDPVTVEMSISKCKGQIGPTGVVTGCYLRSTQRNFNKIDWIAKPVAGISQTVAEMMGWCMALESDNSQRYVNIRYTYPTCQYQVCSFAVQWSDGSI